MAFVFNPDVHVLLFDPGNPAKPAERDPVGGGPPLRANFDPHVHIRWEHRPAVAELDLSAITVNGKALLDARAVSALRAAGYINIKAILAGGLDGLRTVEALNQKTAKDLHSWAMARHAAQFALAELELERPAAVTTEEPSGGEGEEVTG